MIRLVSNWFVAGLILDQHGRVRQAAPILHYMVGWDRKRVLSVARHRGWTVEEFLVYF